MGRYIKKRVGIEKINKLHTYYVHACLEDELILEK